MNFYPKSLKREATNFICRHLDIYPAELFEQLPNNLKTNLLEQILRMKTHSHFLKSQQSSRICQCHYCKHVDTSSPTSHLKRLMSLLINPDVGRLIWTLEDLTTDLPLLSKCKKLRSLQLYVSKQRLLPSPCHNDLLTLFPMLPRLMELKLCNVDRVSAALITDEVLFTLCKSCPLLFSLSVEHCSHLTDACMEAISELKNMSYLNLSKTNLTDAAFVNIRETSPLVTSLTELKLQDCLFLTNSVVKCFLIRCANLTLLNCLGCPRLNNFDLLFNNNTKIQIYFTFDF
ncbi:protein AMN1 homolog [Diaphorina citri]|uniref:Protein AMN1 homolog n=1 Tax=Diaphorina citri TaxID=121845 RepID=A0A3Q0JBL5_DIACI|nr:protein AMN1 homolog [Diaphorina citri]